MACFINEKKNIDIIDRTFQYARGLHVEALTLSLYVSVGLNLQQQCSYVIFIYQFGYRP